MIQLVSGNDEFVVYTCITDSYDELIDVSSHTGIKFICFSDIKKSRFKGWEIQPYLSPPRLTNGHDINRYHKIFSPHLFPEYRYSIYIDGNIDYQGDFNQLVNTFKKSNATLGAFIHPALRNLIEEFNACSLFNKFDKFDDSRKESQLNFYIRNGFDVFKPITANYFIIRDHFCPRLMPTMRLWWSHLFEYTKRDQTSLNYVCWESGLSLVYLDKDLDINHDLLLRYPHKKFSLKLKVIKLKSQLRSCYQRIIKFVYSKK